MAHWRPSRNIRFPPFPSLPCLSSFFLPVEKGKLSKPASQEARCRVCCHLVDHYLFTKASGVFFFFFFFPQGLRKSHKPICHRCRISAVHALFRIDLVFLPNAVLWKVLICEVAEPEPTEFLCKGQGTENRSTVREPTLCRVLVNLDGK